MNQETRAPRTAHRTPLLLVILLAACEVTSPDRTDRYAFSLQPENLVFTWPADRRPVRYFVPEAGALKDYVRAGIETWEAQFLYGEFEGVVSGDSAGADVRVVINGGTPPPAQLTSEPPVQACDGSTAAQLGADNHLQGPMTITVRWFNGFPATAIANCLARVTAHEIGHSIGLFQHSNIPTDLMFGVPAVSTPSSRDRWTAQVLYHSTPTLLPAPRP